MSIDEIENRILAEAKAEEEKIKAEAETAVRQMESVHTSRLESLKQELAERARKKAEGLQRSILVPARQNARRGILEAKQNILDQLYLEIKKRKNLPELEIKRVRENTEVRAAQILFEE